MKKLLPILALLCAFGSQKAAAQPGRWYSYYDYLDYSWSGDISWFVKNIWNDTTSIQHSYSSSTGDSYYNEKFISVGTSFAPRLSDWDHSWAVPGVTIKVGPTDVFGIDSVRLYGTYLRNLAKPASLKDTLRLAFVNGDGTSTSNLPGYSVTVSYPPYSVNFLAMLHDSVKNKAGKNLTGAVPYTQDIILSNTDTAALLFDRTYALTTPYTVPAGKVASMSLTFKTGDPTWTTGDTVEYLSGAYKYGSFRPAVMYHTTGYPTVSIVDSNVGYFKASKLVAPGWDGFYVPTWAWGSGGGASALQYPVIDFHIKCLTCRLADDISGSLSVCEGSTTTYTHTLAGGSWSSSTPAVATVSSSGVVTGVSGGSTTLTYAIGTNFTTLDVYVDPIPHPTITGPTSVCVGNTITLSSSTSSGGWSSSSTGTATVNSLGEVTGVAAGTTTISIAEWSFCGPGYGTVDVTVETLPDAGTLSGDETICLNSTTTITPSITGGSWSTSNSNAFVSGGVVSGVAVGLSVVTYAVTNMCGTSNVQKLVNIVVCPTGVSNPGNEAVINVAPNPTSDDIHISGTTKITNVTIYDVAGQCVFSGQYNSRGVNVSMKEMPAGIYTVKVNNDKIYRVVRQ